MALLFLMWIQRVIKVFYCRKVSYKLSEAVLKRAAFFILDERGMIEHIGIVSARQSMGTLL